MTPCNRNIDVTNTIILPNVEQIYKPIIADTDANSNHILGNEVHFDVDSM